jgi:hypothetical protein
MRPSYAASSSLRFLKGEIQRPFPTTWTRARQRSVWYGTHNIKSASAVFTSPGPVLTAMVTRIDPNDNSRGATFTSLVLANRVWHQFLCGPDQALKLARGELDDGSTDPGGRTRVTKSYR